MVKGAVEIRAAKVEEFPRIVEMFDRYLREAVRAEWHGSAAQLQKAVEEGDVHLLVAAPEIRPPIGFIAWSDAYDLHHCVRGGTVEDMYVEPAFRGRGVGIRLLAAAAASIQGGGGVFLRGMAVAEASVRKLYGRAAVCRETSECTLSGRAFRQLVDLRGRSLRELATFFPDVSWNYEA